jgi:predicted Zn-dependent protease with MMP-like domain
MVAMAEDRFEELVVEAMDGLPPDLAARMDNVALMIEARHRNPNLLGLYQGIPLTNRSHYGNGLEVPDRITIFREPILARCRDDADVRHQVRVTVVHEIAHHFGIDDDRLHELGWA